VAVRVYEIAKQLGISNTDVLDALKKEGHVAKSHMSALSDEALAFIKKRFGKKEEPKKEAAPIKPPEPVRKSKEIMQKQSDKRVSKPVHRPPVLPRKPYERPARVVETPVAAPTEIVVEAMTPAVAAERMGRSANEIIGTLLRWGIVVPKNQTIDAKAVQRLADLYEIKAVQREVEKEKVEEKITGEGLLTARAPVVVILGHVDHGKTSLLDYIRKTRVASREKGGITQHIGAYEATIPQGKIVFLDTPGHAAFPKIRQRGVRVADIAVLIIAADDGIMPQTIEAIKHIKEMGVPVIAAVNKMDRVDEKRIDVVKQQLAQQDLLPEDWGGEVMVVPISAKTGQGVDKLLEMINLQAEMLELRASREGGAKGYVLEAEVERGRGPVATIMSQHGMVRTGDYFSCGATVGRVTSMVDSYGKRIEEVGPATPVRIAGFEDIPDAGDFFQVTSKEEYLKGRSEKEERKSFAVGSTAKEGATNLILKSDTHSSQEALMAAIEKISKKADRPFHILLAGVGNVTESDVELAYNTGSTIITFTTKAEANAITLAQHRGVTIENYDIIYKLLETLEERGKEEKAVEMVRTKIGSATVLRVFDIKKIGVIAGVYINDGRFTRDGYVVGFRKGQKIGEGKISSLQREKKTVKEAHAGFECGFIVNGMTDWQVDDTAECYINMPKK